VVGRGGWQNVWPLPRQFLCILLKGLQKSAACAGADLWAFPGGLPSRST
jgi:hypothetical protein